MKAFYFNLFLFVLSAPLTLLSQSKAAISAKKHEDGKVVYESRIVDLSGTEDINKILIEMGVVDKNGQLIPGNEFQINVMPSDQESQSFDLGTPFRNLPPMAPMKPFSVPSETVAYLGVMAKNDIFKNDGCVQITEVIENSPAAGNIHVGDLIYKIDDQNIATHSELVEFIHSKKPGDEIKLFVYRDGKKKTLKVTLGEKRQEVASPFIGMPDMSYFLSPDSIFLISPFDNKKNCDSTKICQPFSWNEEGFETKETPFLGVTPAEETAVRGVRIGSVIEGSCAEKMGLKAGDIILELNGISTSNFDDLRADVQAIAPGTTVEIKIERDGKEKILEGELGSKSSSIQDDFRIFHDYKGMDENGNLNYNFELDMSVDELEKHLNDMMIDLNDLLNEGGNELQIMMDPYFNAEPGFLNIDNVVAEDLKNNSELSVPGEDLEFLSFSFMPNNENQTVKINFETESKGELELSIYDGSGSKIHVEKRTNFNGLFGKTLSFATYPKGSYVLAIQVGNKRYIKKIIKE
jgi:membrane-associated protease RseP (regulator of RpoE activity)